ncbi:MAG TPA: CrcB family protein [Bacteroidia bacterium]|jgi:CrcB protein|nr:CrcB family protein [Bacteroidia bacterium]
MNWLYVFIGGGIGSVLRFAFSLLFVRWQLVGLAWATLCANVLACVAFVLVWVWFGEKENFMEAYRPFLLVGFCGGLSTFSTFSFETFELFKRGDYGLAAITILLNLILCLFVFAIFARR